MRNARFCRPVAGQTDDNDKSKNQQHNCKWPPNCKQYTLLRQSSNVNMFAVWTELDFEYQHHAKLTVLKRHRG